MKLPYITTQLHTDSQENKDVILAAPCYPTKLSNSGRAEGLFMGWIAKGTAWFFHFLFSESLGSKARLHTPAGCCLGESFFWWNQRKSTSSPRQTTYPFFFLLYSIILSDSPLIWALAPLLIPISERQRALLVCWHASSNWIIPEIWASAQKGICN